MKTTLTITRKGQTTLPVALRRKLGLSPGGGILHIDLDERTGEATLVKPLTIEELSKRLSQNIQHGTEPVVDVDAYYQQHRTTGL